MARLWIIRLCLVLGLLASGLRPASAEPPFLSPSPVLLAQGGSSTAVADGYDALFTNPAGFSLSKGSVTLSSFSAWVYGSPSRLLDTLADPTEAAMIDYLNGEITRGGGGLGAAYGIGWVGRGLGLGLSLTADSFLQGPTVHDATGDLLNLTLGFVAGFALPLKLAGGKVHLGVDFRPMVRVRAPADGNASALAVLDALQGHAEPLAMLNAADALHGFGIGLDMGAIAEFGAFRLGFSVRDFMGTRFDYSRNTLSDIGDTLTNSFNLPQGPAASGNFVIPMTVNLGMSWHPDLGGLKSLIDPILHADLQDIVGGIQEGRSPWTLLHVGMEVGLLSLLKLRAGLDQGYFTMGAGLKILILDVNWALFTRELGSQPRDWPSSGMVVEGAIRL